MITEPSEADLMAIHHRNGDTMTYRYWFGRLTPAWLDHASTPTARRLSRYGNRLRLLRSEYTPTADLNGCIHP